MAAKSDDYSIGRTNQPGLLGQDICPKRAAGREVNARHRAQHDAIGSAARSSKTAAKDDVYLIF